MPEGAKDDDDRYKLSDNDHHSMCYVQSGLNPIKAADLIITQFNNSMIYGIPEESTNAETLPSKETYLAEVS
nr:hypothetical protein CFP56_28416 [Quercus suber]